MQPQNGVVVELEAENATGFEERQKVDPKIAQDKITPDSPRFKEVYGKLKDSERKIEELTKTVESLSSTTEIIDELKNHNMKLAETLEKMIDGKEKDKLVSEVDTLQEKLLSLKQERTNARKELDYERIDLLDDKIDEVKDKMKNAQAKAAQSQTQQTHDPELVEIFQNFVAENPWFEEDEAMQVVAYTYDAKLLKQPKYAKNHIARYAEVKRMVEEKFNYNNRSKSERASFASVEGSSRKSSNGSLQSVTLTPDQVRAADLLGVSHASYAKQLQAIGVI